MTHDEYFERKCCLESDVAEAQQMLEQHLLDGDDLPLPTNLRPAKPKDIYPGSIIWYTNFDNGHGWKEVYEVSYPNDAFKAYTAEDGCRYGLDGAFIEAKGEDQ